MKKYLLKWWWAPAKWWQFWMPGSGFEGATVAAVIFWSLLLIRYLQR